MQVAEHCRVASRRVASGFTVHSFYLRLVEYLLKASSLTLASHSHPHPHPHSHRFRFFRVVALLSSPLLFSFSSLPLPLSMKHANLASRFTSQHTRHERVRVDGHVSSISTYSLSNNAKRNLRPGALVIASVIIEGSVQPSAPVPVCSPEPRPLEPTVRSLSASRLLPRVSHRGGSHLKLRSAAPRHTKAERE